MAFDTRQYEWADLTLVLGGQDITGFQAVKYEESIEREAIHAKGRYPYSIQSGNITYKGEIELLQSEYEKLVEAGNGSVLGLNLDGIIGYGNPSTGDDPIYDRASGIRFLKAAKEMKQGDKYQKIKLPFVCLRIKNQA